MMVCLFTSEDGVYVWRRGRKLGKLGPEHKPMAETRSHAAELGMMEASIGHAEQLTGTLVALRTPEGIAYYTIEPLP